jgi:NADH-quinone oxidoreductase subunit M
MFGRVENPKNERLLDLNIREFVTFAPLLALAVWIGLYPAPFLNRLHTSVAHIMERVNPQYAQAYAADCGGGALSPAAPAGTTRAGLPGAAASATLSTSSFLVAAPCGPDGKPLPQTGAPR